MRKSREIMFLLTLLVGAMIFVLWYVIDRRAKNRAARPAPAAQAGAPSPAHPPAGPGPLPDPVDLTKHDGQTIDFSSGKPVAKNTPEDQAAVDAAVKEMAEATKDVTFGPAAPAKTEPPPKP